MGIKYIIKTLKGRQPKQNKKGNNKNAEES